MSRNLSWSNFYGSDSSIVKEKKAIKSCTSEGFTKRHVQTHFEVPFEKSIELNTSTLLEQYGFLGTRDCFLQLDEFSLFGFAYDLLTASVLNISLDQQLINDSFENVINLYSNNPKKLVDIDLVELSRNSTVLHQLYVMGMMYGHDFKVDLKENFDYKLHNSIHIKTCDSVCDGDYPGGFNELSVPLYALPLVTDKKSLDDFMSFETPTFRTVKGSEISSIHEDYLERREVFWYELTGEMNPSSNSLRNAVVAVRRFNDYMK